MKNVSAAFWWLLFVTMIMIFVCTILYMNNNRKLKELELCTKAGLEQKIIYSYRFGMEKIWVKKNKNQNNVDVEIEVESDIKISK